MRSGPRWGWAGLAVGALVLVLLLVLFGPNAAPSVAAATTTTSVSIVLLGCTTQPRYQQQLQDCVRSWVADADALGWTTRIMVGEIAADTPPELQPYLVPLHCGDDYASATPKHWRGLAYLYQQHPAAWYFVCGSDTYLHVAHAQTLLATLDARVPAYVGGHGDTRRWGDQDYYFHSGGPGYFLSQAALAQLVPEVPAVLTTYFAAPDTPAPFALCDVQAGYLAQRWGWVRHTYHHRFFYCNFAGQPCHRHHPPDPRTLVACHLLSHQDFARHYRR